MPQQLRGFLQLALQDGCSSSSSGRKKQSDTAEGWATDVRRLPAQVSKACAVLFFEI